MTQGALPDSVRLAPPFSFNQSLVQFNIFLPKPSRAHTHAKRARACAPDN